MFVEYLGDLTERYSKGIPDEVDFLLEYMRYYDNDIGKNALYYGNVLRGNKTC